MPHLPRSESPTYAYISRSESLGTCTKRLEDLVHLHLWCDTLSCIIYSWVGLPSSPVSFPMQLKYKVRFFGSPALSGDYPCCTCIPRQFSLISCIFQVQYSAASAVILSYWVSLPFEAGLFGEASLPLVSPCRTSIWMILVGLPSL